MRFDERPRPRPVDERWTIAKIALIALALVIMIALLLLDLEK